MAVHCGSIETLSAQGSKNQISLMILNVLHRWTKLRKPFFLHNTSSYVGYVIINLCRFTEKFRNKMATQTSKWFPLLCRLGLHQAVVVNEKALKLLEEMEENHQCCELSQAMRNEIKTVNFTWLLIALKLMIEHHCFDSRVSLSVWWLCSIRKNNFIHLNIGMFWWNI